MEPLQPVQIITGEDKIINIRLVSLSSGDPYDLSATSALSTCFLNADGSELSLSLGSGVTIVTAAAGKLSITLTSAETALLATLSDQTLELSITQNGLVTKTQIPNAYSVIDGLC